MKLTAFKYGSKGAFGWHGNDWFQRSSPHAAQAAAETTPTEVMQYAGEIHDMSVMDPADILEMFEDYEDPNCEIDEWGIRNAGSLWDFESVCDEARKYKTKTEFKYGSSGAYEWAFATT